MAIRHGTGPALIYAGPGTGKTYTITHHILYLIDDLKVVPDRILVITFTKEAAKEMKARFIKLRPKEGRDVNFGTFHSIYYKVLKAFGNCRLKIAGDSTRYNISSSILEEDKRANFLDLVSSYKSGKSLDILIPDEKDRNEFITNYKLYNEMMREHGLMDYDDILIKCHELLSKNAAVRELVSERFSYVLADEFQDINGIQYETLKLMIPKDRSLYVVGDENQSIYGFRGSKFGIFAEFLQDFPEAARYRLSINYRNHKDIFAAAAKLIGDKEDTKTVNERYEGGFFLSVESTKKEEHELFLRDLEERLKKNERCLVMTRTNRDLAGYEAMCAKISQKYGNTVSVKETDKEILALYEFIDNVIGFVETGERNRLFKALAYKDVVFPRSLFTENIVSLSEIAEKCTNETIRTEVIRLDKMFVFLKRASAPAFTAYLRDVFLRDKKCSDSVVSELNILEKECLKLKTLRNLKELVYERIVEHRRKLDEKRDKALENPAFLTFHASKGLEYDSVFIPDVIEGKIPKRNQLTQTDEDEERRLFYVAMTRAKNRLYIYSVKSEGSQNMVPSRFLDELIK
ncbi:MAG: ATP-dependent helicase [Lachnospiraceae bacterium]|nr:ATP-dependent helicase [Lachnospiraceae bacterium]